ncbi:MAG: CPBP family intramembrane metalloprotease [Armatimonadetes bacterium]|nr:CPBP family intramembrane metalloprotease [Armatimonadota bacterium]
MSYPGNGSRRPRGYFQLSRTLTYSAVMVAPLLVLYEVGVLVINGGSPMGLRNAADVALKEPFLLLGPFGRHLLVALLVVGIAAIYRYEAVPRGIRIIKPYLPLMFVESLFYAAGLGAVINMILRPLLQSPLLAPGIGSLDRTSQIVLSLGAGLYEELVFRVILVSGIFLLLRRSSRKHPEQAYIAAAVLGAAIFSGYHYIGPMSDPFQIHSFLYRFVAGLLFSAIYLARGFGIVVYTHALYDVIVTLS